MKELNTCLITAGEITQPDLSGALGQKRKDQNLEFTQKTLIIWKKIKILD